MKLSQFIKSSCLSLLLLFTTSLAYAEKQATAIFAVGCFWCGEHDFEQVPGVLSVISGYTGGHLKNPTYEQVSAGGTGHFEAIKVIYDPDKITYPKLLDVFWHDIDPTDPNGQFCDKGDQYRAVIFYQDKNEKQLAEASKKAIVDSGKFKEVVALIIPATTFYPAETYHQDYAEKNPLRYRFYRYTCGRDARLEQLWGKQS